ncbi:MAG TPA: NAD(P)/FAD-dependent oxidoreductase [Kineosporiaceae bacterium]|nr:NAD(P)/FAD-dependent oxidoreductase [Kineosporiaceae bacterium]
MYEVIVIGGGPAGMSAALMLGRARRDTLLLDSDKPRNAATPAVHNLFLHDGIEPAEVRRIGRSQLAPYPTVDLRETRAIDVRSLPGKGFSVELADGSIQETRRIILASGLVDRLPHIDGLQPLWGRSVVHCPYCHGFELAGQAVAVIGCEPDRIQLAVHLRRFTNNVALCSNGGDLGRAGGLLTAAGIPVRPERITRLAATGDQVEQVLFESGEPLACDTVFIRTVSAQHSEIPARLGCDTLADGTLEINEFGQTTVPGVYAAGDLARRRAVPVPLAQVTLAAAAGTIAAGAIDQELLLTDVGLSALFIAMGARPGPETAEAALAGSRSS